MSSRERGQKRRDEGRTTSSQMHTATQENQRSDRSTSEGGGRDKLKKSWRWLSNMHETEKRQQRWQHERKRKPERKRRGRLKHYNVDGDVPLCLRKTEEKSKDGSSSSNKKYNEEKIKAEAAYWTEWRMEAKAKWRAEAKICAAILQGRKTMKKRCYVYRTTKKYEINALKWKNRRNGMRARRLQMGCNIIEWNVETRQVRNLGDTSQTHIHGSRKIRQQTTVLESYAEQEVEAKNYW